MTKRKHNLIIISLLFALLLGLVLVLVALPAAKDDDTPTADSTSTFENLLNTDGKKIVKVSVKNALDEYDIKVEEKDDKQVYILSGLDEAKTAQSSAAVLVESLINLKPTKIISDETLDLSLYGLSEGERDTQLVITFDNDEKVTLYLGAEAPLSQGAYIKIEGDSKVYVISSRDTEIFLNEKSFYQEDE